MKPAFLFLNVIFTSSFLPEFYIQTTGNHIEEVKKLVAYREFNSLIITTMVITILKISFEYIRLHPATLHRKEENNG